MVIVRSDYPIAILMREELRVAAHILNILAFEIYV